MSEPLPIDHPPHGDPAEQPGWSGRAPGLRRVVAQIRFEDGHAETITTFAHEWTRDRVLVSVRGEWPGALISITTRRVWVPAHRVRAPDRPPAFGELVPKPEAGPTDVTVVAPTHCANGHELRGRCSVRWHQCSCHIRAHGGSGYHTWACWTCGDVTSGPPPHDTPDNRPTSPTGYT